MPLDRPLTEADITVGSRWKWGPMATKAQGLRLDHVGLPFIIISVRGTVAEYAYYANSTSQRHLATILEYATPVIEKCAPECCPRTPCKAHEKCPGNGPEYNGDLGYLAWTVRHGHGLPYADAIPYRRFDLLPSDPEPMRNGSGALACDWILRR